MFVLSRGWFIVVEPYYLVFVKGYTVVIKMKRSRERMVVLDFLEDFEEHGKTSMNGSSGCRRRKF